MQLDAGMVLWYVDMEKIIFLRILANIKAYMIKNAYDPNS